MQTDYEYADRTCKPHRRSNEVGRVLGGGIGTPAHTADLGTGVNSIS